MEIRRNILKTLVYHDIFSYPLTFAQLSEYLITEESIQQKDIKREVSYLLKQQMICFYKGYYCLSGRELIIPAYIQRLRESREKFTSAAKIFNLLSRIPTIRFLAISGSLARNNANKGDDIDLFVITAPKTIWITRLVILSVLQLMGRRRVRGERDVQNKFCVNFFMDTDTLSFPLEKHDLYTAFELSQIRPVVDKENILWTLYMRNSWMRQFLAHKPLPVYTYNKLNIIDKILILLFSLCEGISRRLQWKIMHKHITTETVNRHQAAFHPLDYRKTTILTFHRRSEAVLKRYLWDIDKEKEIIYTRQDEASPRKKSSGNTPLFL